MNHINNFNQYNKLFEEVEMVGSDIQWDKLRINKSKEEIKKQYLKELGKRGELVKYITETGKTHKLTFGLLKSLFHDAIAYKKRREYTKGFYKFVHRAIPMALSFIWFPIWLISNILGGSRSINKILIPVFKLKNRSYNNFLTNIVIKTMHVMEGEIKYVMGNDWFYNVFMVDWGLIKMVRKEHIIDFAEHVANIMENEPDDKIAPLHYVENEFRKYLNDKFNLNPPMPLKEEKE